MLPSRGGVGLHLLAHSTHLPRELWVNCPAWVCEQVDLFPFLLHVSTPPWTGHLRRDSEGINRTALRNHRSPECHFFNVQSAKGPAGEGINTVGFKM